MSSDDEDYVLDDRSSSPLPEIGTRQDLLAALAELKADISIAHEAAESILHLAHACENNAGNALHVVSADYADTINALFAATTRSDCVDGEFRNTLYGAIDLLILSGSEDRITPTSSALMLATDRLMDALRATNSGVVDMNLLTLLCRIVISCIEKLPKHIINDLGDRLMNVLIPVLSVNCADAQENALMACSRFAEILGLDFSRYLPVFHQPFLEAILSKESSMFAASAAASVCEIAGAVEKMLTPFAESLVDALIIMISSNDIDRDDKPHAITSFADIALAIEGDFAPLTERTMLALQRQQQIEMEYAFNLQAASSRELESGETTSDRLKEAIITAYEGVLQGLRAEGMQEVAAPFVEKVIDFARYCAEVPQMSTDVLKRCVGIAGDIINCFGVRYLDKLEPFVDDLISEAKQCEDEEVKQVALWAEQLRQTAQVAGPQRLL